MSRFSDYLSSQITPQMTLLEKFNVLIKFLKENNYISIFYSSENYSPIKTNYDISKVSKLNYELKLGDCIVFSNGYYAFVETLGEETFTIGNILYFQGEQGVSVVSATINSSGNLILTLSDGNTVNAGNTGAVKDFIIDANQHLIVRYLNGTSNDLGSIFNGDISISGDLTATGTIDGNKITGNEIVEKMSSYNFTIGSASTGITRNISYAGVVKNGNKITFAIAGTISQASGGSSNQVLGTFTIPTSIGSKLIPTVLYELNIIDNKKLSFIKSANTMLSETCVTVKNNNSGFYVQLLNMNDLEADTPYFFRYEVTFLLSDNMAS